MNADSGNVSKTDIKRINRLRRSNCHGLKLQANAKMQHDHQKDARLRLLSCSAILWIVEGFQINKTIATRQTQRCSMIIRKTLDFASSAAAPSSGLSKASRSTRP
jgi:hypothetical protein